MDGFRPCPINGGVNMNNGTSSLLKGFSANIYAALVFFVGAILSFFNGFSGWLGTILLVIAFILFLLEKNTFVRRAFVIVAAAMLLMFISWLLFVVILDFPFFHTINWIIDIALLLYLVFCGLCAINGKEAPVPFINDFIEKLC